MKSDTPKVLHPLLGKPLVMWAVEMAEAVSERKPVLVVGYGQEQVRQVVGERADYVEQNERLGTGHAVRQAKSLLSGQIDAVVVTYGDMPLLRAETIRRLVELFEAESASDDPPVMAMLSVIRDDTQGFGRIVRDDARQVSQIIEDVDCTPAQREIRELNPGIYCFDAVWLWRNIEQIPVSAKGEYYLTDLVGLATLQGRRVVTVQAPLDEVDGINTRVHLSLATSVLRRRIMESHMLNGVSVVDPETTYVESDVSIGRDTVLLPGTVLQGKTVIGLQSTIGPYTQVVDSSIGNGCRVSYSVVEQAVMEDRSDIGPFGHLRKGAHLGVGAHMGNFGEIKNSTLGSGAKMGHFGYLGDADVGADANIGAGTITCNYDGENKHPTKIGSGAFIGSDTMLVAPVTIGDGARTGAGSVVTRDVQAGEIAYGVPARTKGKDAQSEGE